ncbi:hypothetical protein RQP46_004336 [Phenoliferia psychrophenolica]
MATFTGLSPELLSHIFKLSTEGEHASEEQRARFQFGVIARACYLATANATTFYVKGVEQVNSLVTRIEEEEERQGEPGRTAPSTLGVTRVTNIRQLSIAIDGPDEVRSVVRLLGAVPNLVALDLDVEALSAAGASSTSWLRLRFFYRILISLKHVEELSIKAKNYYFTEDANEVVPRLPRLRYLRISIDFHWAVFVDPLLHALATSSGTGLQGLDLGSTPYSNFIQYYLNQLFPHVTTITSFTWAPDASGENRKLWRDRVHALLGATLAVVHLTSLNLLPPSRGPNVPPLSAIRIRYGIDHKLFDTLAALPVLHTVKLLAKEGHLDIHPVSSFISSCESLCFLSLDITDGWSRQERDHLEEAAEKAGVIFKYIGPSD